MERDPVVWCQVVCSGNRWPPQCFPADGQMERCSSSSTEESTKTMTTKMEPTRNHQDVASPVYWAWVPVWELEEAYTRNGTLLE